MSRRPEASARKPAGQDEPPDLRLLLLASLVAALGYALLPDVSWHSDAIATMTVFRGVLAGCVAGLVVRRDPWWAGPAVTTIGIAVGAVAVGLITATGAHTGAVIAGLALGCGAALLLSWLMSSNLAIAAEAVALAAVIAALLWGTGALPGAMRTGTAFQTRQAALSAEPRPETYRFDGVDYLRTYYLMRQGVDYYAAFRQAVIEDARHDASFITSPFNYREPFVFYVWSVLPGASGAALWDWFLVYTVLVLVCSYVLASSLVARGVALLAPIALVGWFFAFFWSAYFLITEVWAAGLGVAAVMCLVRRWRVPSLVLLTVAVAAREFMVLLIPAWLLVAWSSRGRKESWWFAAAAVLGPACVLGAHFLAVPATAAGAGGAGTWLHGGPARLVAALRFGFDYVPAGMWVSLAIAGAAIAGAAVARPHWRMAALLAVTILPTVFLLAFSGGEWGLYWGAFYTPLAVSIAPGVLGRVLPPEVATT